MKFNETVTGSIEAIRKGKGRSVLAITILALGMGSLMAMTGLGLSGMGQFQKSISANDATEIRVTPGEQGKAILNDAAIESFKKMEGVAGATGVITLPLQVQTNRYKAENIAVSAVDPSVLKGKLEYTKGGPFSVQGTSPQLILGYGAQMEFKDINAGEQTEDDGMGYMDENGGEGQPLEPTPPPIDWMKESIQVSIANPDGDGEEGEKPDDTAPDANRVYMGRIVGVLEKDESDRNGKALMSLTAAKKMLQENYELATSLDLKTDTYATALVYAKDIGSAKDILESIAAMGYTAESAVGDLAGMQEKLDLQQTLLTLIGIFAVAATGLVLAYTLLTGLKGDAPAASRAEGRNIRRRLLVQSSILGLAGGALGVLVAYFFALIVNTSTAETVVFGMHFGQSSNVDIPFWLALVTMAISTATGFFAGLPPAYRAGKVRD